MATEPLWKRSLGILLSAGHPMVDVTVKTIRARHSLPRRAAAIVLGVELANRPPTVRTTVDGTAGPVRVRKYPPLSPRSRWLGSLVTAAAVATVLVGVLATVIPLLRPAREVSSAQQWPAATPVFSTNAALPASTSDSKPEGTARTQLEQRVVEDRASVEALVGSWVPEVSAKKVGLVVSGTTFDYPAILAEHRHLLAVYPQALLLKSQDYQTFRLPDYWVTVVAIPFTTAAGANTWCDNMGIGPSDCLAARLTHTAGSQGNTVTRNR
ncbi:hypothetical protein [Amycolatopsis sp. lyj-109]|uniref:hypothetical protein n=1 Tax=Amycolatopsis sp. lyj-109 TaxID=2789287 RepID=UPI00397839EB